MNQQGADILRVIYFKRLQVFILKTEINSGFPAYYFGKHFFVHLVGGKAHDPVGIGMHRVESAGFSTRRTYLVPRDKGLLFVVTRAPGAGSPGGYCAQSDEKKPSSQPRSWPISTALCACSSATRTTRR